MASFAIGILGFGNVGQGVAKILLERKQTLLERTGISFSLKKIYCRNFRNKDLKGIPVEYFTEKPEDILNDTEINVVVEVIGGAEIAYDFVQKALLSGKDVVTSNKTLIATHGEELLLLAKQQQKQLLFEAAVAGSIPILRILREHFVAGEISKITGILNGTCNYLLSEIEKGGKTYGEVLQAAQKLGFAEADPSFDTEGADAAQKLAILTSLAFGIRLPNWKDIPRNGITALLPEDFQFAEKMDKRIRLLGKAEMTEHGLFIGVHPRMVDSHSSIGKTVGAENVLLVEDEFQSPLKLAGAGAGSLPTAMSILSDLGECARGGVSAPFFAFTEREECVFAPRELITKEVYFRVEIRDQIGIIASIAEIFAKKNISISGIFHNDEHTIVAFLLQESPITSIEESAEEIASLGFVRGKPIILPVES